MKSEARKEKLKYLKKLTPEQEYQIAGEIANKLTACYPGHLWAVQIDQRLARIKNLLLSRTMGFTVDLVTLTPEMKEVMRAGGELLERFGQKRGWIDNDGLAVADRNITGDMKYDD